MTDHTHTWTFDSSSKLIRLYLWAWEGSATQINFCKLFWGLLFLPIALSLHATFFVYDHLIRLLPERKEETREQRAVHWREEHERYKAKIEKGPNVFQRTLTRISTFFDKLAEFLQIHETVAKALSVVLLTIPTIAIVGGFIALWILFPIVMLEVFAGIIGVVLVTAGVLAILYSLDTSGKGKKIGDAIARGFGTFFAFLGTGYHAVKYRTCPAVVVKGASDKESVPA